MGWFRIRRALPGDELDGRPALREMSHPALSAAALFSFYSSV
jgi:hypothetical protein